MTSTDWLITSMVNSTGVRYASLSSSLISVGWLLSVAPFTGTWQRGGDQHGKIKKKQPCDTYIWVWRSDMMTVAFWSPANDGCNFVITVMINQARACGLRTFMTECTHILCCNLNFKINHSKMTKLKVEISGFWLKSAAAHINNVNVSVIQTRCVTVNSTQLFAL